MDTVGWMSKESGWGCLRNSGTGGFMTENVSPYYLLQTSRLIDLTKLGLIAECAYSIHTWFIQIHSNTIAESIAHGDAVISLNNRKCQTCWPKLVAYKTLSIHHQSMFHDEHSMMMKKKKMAQKIINLMGSSGLIIGPRLPS